MGLIEAKRYCEHQRKLKSLKLKLFTAQWLFSSLKDSSYTFSTAVVKSYVEEACFLTFAFSRALGSALNSCYSYEIVSIALATSVS